MINQRHCPFCKVPAAEGCSHLALAAEGRDFVQRCVELSQGHDAWAALCRAGRNGGRGGERPDYTWLETAFCDKFLKHLRWFGGLEHEWRTGPTAEQGGFWVILWSKDPQRLWWELRDELERGSAATPMREDSPPWLVWLSPR